jgi:hypothetical protein
MVYYMCVEKDSKDKNREYVFIKGLIEELVIAMGMSLLEIHFLLLTSY